MKTLKIKNILNFLDENILLIISGFLVAFIPLWPKIPLFSPIEQYIVRVRLEDIFIFLAGIIWLIQVFRKKIAWKNIYLYLVIAYAVISLLSILNAIFIIKTIPLEPLHVGKSLLHYFRYLEYFSLFFITFSSVKSEKNFKTLLLIIALTILGLSIYGFGQKNWYWPVYSTMNREFSKGVRLYLTEHARVQSTFAGHYDLGAYLVVILPIIFGVFLAAKKKLVKVIFFLSFLFGIWLLVVSASRTSFISYLAGVGVLLGISTLMQTGFKAKFSWGFKYGLLVLGSTTIMMGLFGSDMYERFLQVLEGYPELNSTYHELNAKRKTFLIDIFNSISYLGFSVQKPEIPENAVGIDNSGYGIALVPSDERPVTEIPKNKPSDVYVDVPEPIKVSTVSATGETITVIEERERIFSDCAIQKGLSLCIRLETLWPQAIAGFEMSPFLGKGFATLNKESIYQFTEAESTDNNFLRTLGETGFLGFVSFYSVAIVAIWQSYLHLKDQEILPKFIGAAFIAGSFGLFINALYIDVFAASKVALSYWALTGIVIAYLSLFKTSKSK